MLAEQSFSPTLNLLAFGINAVFEQVATIQYQILSQNKMHLEEGCDAVEA